MQLRIREPINSMSHMIGVLLSIAGLVILIMKTAEAQSVVQMLAVLIFGISLIALYSSSMIYHWVTAKAEVIRVLRKVDHCMIYVLIAGTYTPVCLLSLKGGLGIALLITVWSLAVLGIILKLVWFDAPRWLYTGFYLLLGWISIFFIYPISKALPGTGLFLLILGGILYSAGAAFYAIKPQKLRVWKLGFHEVFHLFILAGSITHYLFIYHYVLG